MNKKKMKRIHTWIRAAIQILYFVCFPSAFTAAFGGVKYIFSQIGAGERVELTSFVAVLIALCIYTAVFGRFFCGFACAFGSLGDGVYALFSKIRKKRKKRPRHIPERIMGKLKFVKYVILLVAAVLSFGGFFPGLSGSSPWDVFSMLHAGNFRLGGYLTGIILLILILVGMALQERFFCRVLCPMGAVFSMFPVLPLFTLRRDRENCLKGCRACTATCPSDLELPSSARPELSGECFQCRKCIDLCPKENIRTGFSGLRGNEIWFTVIQAGILMILFLWLL